MGFSYLNNIPLEEAVQRFLTKIQTTPSPLETEEIPVNQGLGRITAKAVYAEISAPHYNACAMDGIAVKASSTFGATETTPVTLHEERDFENHNFMRVDTGDPLDDRFDAVIMIEDVIELGGGQIQLLNAAAPWQHVRQIGEDICAGEMIIPTNTVIEPSMIGAMLAGGVETVEVRKRPLVGIIPTGDEIRSTTIRPGKGEIIEYNSSIFTAMLQEWGAVSRVYDVVPDRLDQIKAAIHRASRECDMVLVNAGSSAGREDFTAQAIESVGEVDVHGIAIRPGKPTILGVLEGKPIIGVPGYPVSGMIVMDQVVRKIVETLVKAPLNRRDSYINAVLTRKLVSSLKYQEFIRVKLGEVGGRLTATPLNRGAGVVTSFVKADGILEIPLNSEGLEAGSNVKVKLLKSEEQIQNTLVLIGSHDPLIDEIVDIIRGTFPDEYVASAHVGSMGGIMAVKRGEAHIAGIHLLDESTGAYNVSYIRKYLSGRKICLIRGVTRIQGLMVKKGNPCSVTTLGDIARTQTKNVAIRYVNRQKGSGTRILLDYLLQAEHISPDRIEGYDREEFTHMAVAALVASDSADAGMGIYSAARAFDLDFVPICEEQYDFIVPEGYMSHPGMRRFIDVLKSSKFRTRLEKLGGYEVINPGEVQIIE